MQGKQISGYTLQRLLGTGGMAEVWYAENKIGKRAAVKILLPKLCADDNVKSRFYTEAKVMVELDHPNIRQVYDYGDIDGRPAIVMEYLEGDDLKARMKRGQHFTDEELKRWWNQLVDALNYTHEQGIVHRDIKPGNIFVDPKGNIKLLDFGIAKVRESISSTQTGQKLGTLMYMSPEQVKDSKHVDYRTDIYSLAVTFVHLITGKKPYNSDTTSDFEISELIVYKPLDLHEMLSDWQSFLAPYLDKAPKERPALRHFENTSAPASNAISEDEGTIVGDTPARQTPQKVALKPKQSEKPKSKKGLWIGLVIAIVAVVGIVLMRMKTIHDTQLYGITFSDAMMAVTELYDDNVGIDSDTGKALLVAAFGDNPQEKKMLKRQMIRKIKHLDLTDFGLTQNDMQKVEGFVGCVYLYLEKKGEPIVVDSDTEAYQACQTIADYRAYMRDYGRNALHYYEARQFVDNYMTDSIQQAQRAIAEAEVMQRIAETEKAEDAAYKKCTTIPGCDAYLKKYPEGRYVEQVKKKQKELEEIKANEDIETVTLHTVYSGPKGDLACVYYFARDSYDINERRKLNREAPNALREKIAEGIEGFRVIAWCTLEEREEMADNRANAVKQEIIRLLKRWSESNNSYGFQSITAGMDWETMITSISQSDIRDKETILEIIRTSSDKERSFREICDMYPQLEKDIIPSLRRVEVYVY